MTETAPHWLTVHDFGPDDPDTEFGRYSIDHPRTCRRQWVSGFHGYWPGFWIWPNCLVDSLGRETGYGPQLKATTVDNREDLITRPGVYLIYGEAWQSGWETPEWDAALYLTGERQLGYRMSVITFNGTAEPALAHWPWADLQTFVVHAFEARWGTPIPRGTLYAQRRGFVDYANDLQIVFGADVQTYEEPLARLVEVTDATD